MAPANARKMPPKMSHDDGRDSSDPPPPHPSDANSVDLSLSRSDHAVAKARAAMASAEDAGELAQQALDVSKAIELKIGNSPDPAMGVPGRGLFGVVSGLVGDVHLVGSKVDTLVANLDAAAATRRGSLGKIAGMILGPTFAIGVAALLGWLAGFHR